MAIKFLETGARAFTGRHPKILCGFRRERTSCDDEDSNWPISSRLGPIRMRIETEDLWQLWTGEDSTSSAKDLHLDLN